jgi:hypothetical protein
MARKLARIVVAAALVGCGWLAGSAQTQAPDFELVVNAPVGETTVTCKRGCDLLWVERGIPTGAERQSEFSFRCGGAGVQRCSSATVGGWIRR